MNSPVPHLTNCVTLLSVRKPSVAGGVNCTEKGNRDQKLAQETSGSQAVNGLEMALGNVETTKEMLLMNATRRGLGDTFTDGVKFTVQHMVVMPLTLVSLPKKVILPVVMTIVPCG